VVSPDETAAVVESCKWHTVAASRWRKEEHINVLELRALCTALRWVLSFRSAIGKRVLVLSDSQVVVGAVMKGRSSSPQLLRRLRALSALVLAGGVRLSVRWVRSELNPADEPSRRFCW
jgi:ribonuclease HI